MDTLLKIFFKRIMHKVDGLEEIKTIHDLHQATLFYTEDLLEMLMDMNDDRDGFCKDEMLLYANLAYQEVCAA